MALVLGFKEGSACYADGKKITVSKVLPTGVVMVMGKTEYKITEDEWAEVISGVVCQVCPRVYKNSKHVKIAFRSSKVKIHTKLEKKCPTCGGKKQIVVSEECQKCGGHGCKHCKAGRVQISSKCPDC